MLSAPRPDPTGFATVVHTHMQSSLASTHISLPALFSGGGGFSALHTPSWTGSFTLPGSTPQPVDPITVESWCVNYPCFLITPVGRYKAHVLHGHPESDTESGNPLLAPFPSPVSLALSLLGFPGISSQLKHLYPQNLLGECTLRQLRGAESMGTGGKSLMASGHGVLLRCPFPCYFLNQ